MRLLTILILLAACQPKASINTQIAGNATIPTTIRSIKLPENSARIQLSADSFGEWLRNCTLKEDATVYLYNGKKKSNQSAQVAVLDINIGKKDLQQCADAVIRLRAEYLRSINAEDKIRFHASDGTLLDYNSWKSGYRWKLNRGKLIKQQSAPPSGSRAGFQQYLELVFMYSGTHSLQKELIPVKFKDILPGDVIIQGGSPGHAVIVMDVATTSEGEKQFLLAQSYMPAQDIHVLRNPLLSGKQPWYTIPEGEKLYTPEWGFTVHNCRRFAE